MCLPPMRVFKISCLLRNYLTIISHITIKEILTSEPVGSLRTVEEITNDWKIIAKKRITKLIAGDLLRMEPDTYEKYYSVNSNPFFG